MWHWVYIGSAIIPVYQLGPAVQPNIVVIYMDPDMQLVVDSYRPIQPKSFIIQQILLCHTTVAARGI